MTPDDVKAVAGPVMAHRVVLSYGQNRYADALRLIEEILNTVPAPTEDFFRSHKRIRKGHNGMVIIWILLGALLAVGDSVCMVCKALG